MSNKIIQIGKATLINGDCMEYMSTLKDKEFDLAVVDPPYGININQMNMGSRKTVKPTKKGWDLHIPNKEYFNKLFSIASNQIIFGGNYFPLPNSQYFAIWDKGETMYGRDFAECEYAWVRSGGTRIFKLNPNQLDRFHPTQKPVKLYEWVLLNYAKPGQRILDTHGGSMSSVIAALNLGFEIVCIEKDEEYFNAAADRVIKSQQQQRMF